MITDEMLNMASEAFSGASNERAGYLNANVLAALIAAYPLIRAQVIEKCAGACEDCAEAIREMK